MSPILLIFLIILLVLLLIMAIKVTLSDLEPTKPLKKDWKEFVDDIAQETLPKVETDKNKDVIKTSPEIQKQVVNVRAEAKTQQPNRKSKRK